MNIPNLLINRAVTKDGKLHPEFERVLTQLIQELQKNLSNEGYKVPQQPTPKITQLNTQNSIGALLYDSDTHQLKVNINGTFKVVTVT